MPEEATVNAAAGSRKRVTVMFSGGGTNMSSLISASMSPDYPAIITHAITNNPEAGGLGIAKTHNIECSVIDHKNFDGRQEHEAEIIKAIEEANPDIICLAGYMRIFTDDFIRQYRGKLINIHPSLLPSFRGVDTHHRVRTEGVLIHGASVHFVNETLDGGPIIAQIAVPVLPDDSDESLAARVLVGEHKLFPHALEMVASGKVRLSNTKAVFTNVTDPDPENLLMSPGIDT